MKQHIEVNQLQELTEKQQQRLRGWWKPEPGDWYLIRNKTEQIVYTCDSKAETITYAYDGWEYDEAEEAECEVMGSETDRKDDCLPLLSIGQMIELLNEKAIAVDIKTTNMDTADGNKAYLLIHNFLDTKACNSTELADALWSAVKEVL